MLRNHLDDKTTVIGSLELFFSCSPAELALVAGASDLLDLPAGAVLCREATHGEEAFIVVEGEVRVERDGHFVAQLGPGEIFGEMSIIDRLPRSASVTAVDDVRLLVFGRRELRALMETVPALSRGLLATMSQRLRTGS